LFRQGLTVLIVPSVGRTMRKVRLRGWFISFAALLAVGLVLGGIYFGQDYIRIKQALPDVARLEKENHQQQAQILAFAEKISRLKAEMEKLAQFNKKLKGVLNVASQDSSQFFGQGGSESEMTKAKAALDQHRQEMIRQMHDDLNRLSQEASLTEQIQQELHAFLESRKSILAATPSIWPARGWVTSSFGYRRSPFTGKKEFHKGMDIANRSGTPIVAPANGIVAKVGRENGYGRVVVLHHGYGLATRYAHLHKTLVKPGQHVKRGQKLALMGNSGRSTGSHLHYEVWLNGLPVNPSRYLLSN